MNKKASRRLESLVEQIDRDLVETLMDESDRGCMLVASSFIEEAMEHFLRDHFTKLGASPEDTGFLLTAKPNAPLGTFHARIVICSALNLIDSDVRDSLMKFKSLRNQFAHRNVDTPNPKLTEESILTFVDLLPEMQSLAGDDVLDEMAANEETDHLLPVFLRNIQAVLRARAQRIFEITGEPPVLKKDEMEVLTNRLVLTAWVGAILQKFVVPSLQKVE